jgi:hypothetical protein
MSRVAIDPAFCGALRKESDGEKARVVVRT